MVQASFAQTYVELPKDIEFPSSANKLDVMRRAGNLNEEREHLWTLFSGITRSNGQSTAPIFLTWYGAGEVFAASTEAEALAGHGMLQSLSLPRPKDSPGRNSGSSPLIVRAHYNRAAYAHIRLNRLEDSVRLIAGAQSGSIPAFPRDAIVIKTVWWPVPEHGVVAVPVWDPASNRSRATGNDYLTWTRVVGVSTRPGFGADTTSVDVEFLGRLCRHVHAVGVDALYHVTLDERTAASLMSDPEARRVAGLALGRSLHANDMVVLVALHLATRELEDWVWGTFWWHDRSEKGPFKPPPEPRLPQPWRNYLMSVSFDTTLPLEPDGSPHVAFNPWLEGRIADGGHGNGLVSNCMTCHQRASTAAEYPFLVTRGRDNLQEPAAVRQGAVTTSSLWSLPLQAR